MKKKQDLASLILRLCLGGMMLLHGIAKISSGVEGIGNSFNKVGLSESLAYSVYIGEVIAPLMLIVGFRTKLGALLLGITMLVAVWLAHLDDVFTLGKGGGWALELQSFYFFGAMILLLLGGGKYAMSTRSKLD